MFVAVAASGFRNLAPLELALGAGACLVTGDNGAGKTSLLEALYVLATTKSFRSADLGDCIAHGEAGAELAGETVGNSRVGLSVSLRPQGGSRQVNGRVASLREHLAVQAVVSWTAADALLWSGVARDRRRFVDRGLLLLDPGDLQLIARFGELIRQKRRLLAQRRGAALATELEAWNELLAAAGSALQARRAAFLAALQSSLDELVVGLGLDLPRLELAYLRSPAEELSLAEALERQQSAELAVGRPLIGPQRDDLALRWSGRATRRVASGGERKALGLLLVAAQSTLASAAERSPVALLDDLDAELDRRRLEALWPAFARLGQLVASSSRPELLDGLGVARRLAVRGGRVSE